MNCSEVREALPGYVREEELSLPVRRHLATCAGCKADYAEYEALMRALTALASKKMSASPALIQALLSVPTRARPLYSVRHHVARNRTVYVGGVAAAVAGATGALLLHRRNRLAVA
jgi:anti-sigma factor RsiW